MAARGLFRTQPNIYDEARVSFGSPFHECQLRVFTVRFAGAHLHIVLYS